MSDVETLQPPRIARKRLVLISGFVGVVVAWVATGVVLSIHLNDATAENADLSSQLDTLSADLDEAHQTNLDLRVRVSNAEIAQNTAATDLQKREDVVAAREAAAQAKEQGLADREAAVKAREDAATANSAADWWITEARECLNRPGSYRTAYISVGALDNNISCMSG